MTDDDLTRLGFTAEETAELDRLLDLMVDGPPPPGSGPEGYAAVPRGVWLRRVSRVVLAAVAVMLAIATFSCFFWFIVWLGNQGVLPAPTY